MKYLKFTNYVVNDIHFKRNNDATDGQFRVNPNIRVDVKRANEVFLVSVSVTIDKTQNSPVPFELGVNVAGSFVVISEGVPAEMLDEGFTFLFPFVRSIVTNLTTNANMPAYFLPVISLTAQQAAKKNTDTITVTPVETNDD